MVEEDLSSVCEIENLSYPNPWHKSTFIGEIHNNPISVPMVFVQKAKKEIIGYIIFWLLEDEVQINNIAVHPDYRRMGIAEKVFHCVLDQIQKDGAKFVSLEVRPSNFVARSLYNKLGFRVLGVRQNYYRNPPENALVMGKQLGKPGLFPS
jgi:ribosomal-protein-alanine N-acetyltransferase